MKGVFTMESLFLFFGFILGSFSTCLIVRYKQRKSIKLIEQMQKSHSVNSQSFNSVNFTDVEDEDVKND